MALFNLDEDLGTEIIQGFKVKFVHGEKMTVAYFDVLAGAELPEHSHAHEQISSVIEGQFELTIDGNTEIMKSGKVAVIPPYIKHSGKALTNCKIIDVFHPVRDDYKLIPTFR